MDMAEVSSTKETLECDTNSDTQSESEIQPAAVSIPIVAGVEENVNSRFIDYSIATPWEDLIASIERVLRSWKPYVPLSCGKVKPVGSNHPSFAMDIDYNGTKMKLEFMMGSSVYSANESTEASTKQPNMNHKMSHYFDGEGIPLWFTVRKYVLLTRHNGSILGESERRLMFSAIIAALDASQVEVPAFVSASPSTSISQSLEVLGYMIMSPRQAEITLHSQDSLITTGPQVVHYECQTLSSVSNKHPFFYLDGLMRMFGAKLWKFSRGNILLSDETANVVISAVEFYEFRYVSGSSGSRARLVSPPDTSASRPVSDERPLSSSALEAHPSSQPEDIPLDTSPVELDILPVVKCTLDDFLVCYPSHINNVDGRSGSAVKTAGHEFSQVSHQSALALMTSSQDNKHTKHTDLIQKERNNSDSSFGSYGSGKGSEHSSALLQAFHQGPPPAKPTTPAVTSINKNKNEFQLPLEKIVVQVHFKDLKHGTVVDNDYYTTLLPSKLPPSSWGAKATFAPVSKGGGSVGYMDILSPPLVSPLYAMSLRRLLALYVCGKSARSDSTFRTILDSLETYGNLQGCISTDRAIDISSVLSLECRRAVVFLCASASNSSYRDASSNRVQHDLLMRVFSRSLWVDESSASPSSASINGGGEPPVSSMGDARNTLHPTWDWLTARVRASSSPDLVTSSAPVGSWLSLVSVYMSSLDTVMSMATFWQECMDEVRVHWENRVPIPRLFPPVPIMKPTSNTEKSPETDECGDDSSDGDSDMARGVWLEPFWSDITAEFKKTVSPFELPDLEQNLPHQKLQMVNMCIICGGVASTVDERLVTKCVKKARHQLASRLKKLQEQGLGTEILEQDQVAVDSTNEIEEVNEAVDMSENTDSSSEGFVVASTQSLKELVAMDVSGRDLSHINPPKLQRRLPMTADALAQHRHLANKLRQGSSRSVSENTMLRWQILYPELISDVRAFKACNETVFSTHVANDISGGATKPVTFEDFVVWYGGAGVLLPRLPAQANLGDQHLSNERGLDGISLENLKNLWDECDEEGVKGQDQKPLFKAEQEAEKALGYLEGMTIVQIARTMLSSALPSIHMLLTHDVQRTYQHLLKKFKETVDKDGILDDSHGPKLKSIFDPGQALSQDLDKISVLIRTALHDLHFDTPLMGTTASKVNVAGSSARAGGAGNKEEAVNQQALLSIDAACTAIAQMEILLMKIESAAATLEYHPRLVGHIAKYGSVSAATEDEARIILSLAKCASFGQDSHSWHSYDGRELGVPKKKIFDIRCQAKNSLLNKSTHSMIDTEASTLDGVSHISSAGVSSSASGDDESWANVDYYQDSSGKTRGAKRDEDAISAANGSASAVASHQMMVVLEEGSLRVAFRLQEDDI